MRLTTRWILVAAIAALALPATVAANGHDSIVAGATVYRPDARIAKKCSNVPSWQNCDPSMVGDNRYNGTARNQKRNHIDYLTYSTERDPRTIVFRISIQNDGTVADRFRVSADGSSAGYLVTFWRRTRNVTAAVESGNFTTPVVEPGAAFVIKAKVVMPCDSWTFCGQDEATRLVTVKSVGDPSVRDAVRFTRKIWACTC